MISREFIRQAAEEYFEASMAAIPSESECDHIFSERFEEDMKFVIRKRSHLQAKRVLRMAASFALVILLTGGSVMALSPAARAAVTDWLFGREGDAYTYRSTGTDANADSDTVTAYDLAVIPEGYALWENIQMPNSGFVLYSEKNTGRLLKVFFAPNDGSGALYLIPEDATRIPILLGEISADFYQSNTEESSSTIVWTDPENSYLVCVDGFFTQEELVNMAANLIRKEIPRPE